MYHDLMLMSCHEVLPSYLMGFCFSLLLVTILFSAQWSTWYTSAKTEKTSSTLFISYGRHPIVQTGYLIQSFLDIWNVQLGEIHEFTSYRINASIQYGIYCSGSGRSFESEVHLVDPLKVLRHDKKSGSTTLTKQQPYPQVTQQD